MFLDVETLRGSNLADLRPIHRPEREGDLMIFSVGDHIQQIIAGKKTQTRRKSGGYIVGKTYAVQPGRTKPGIPEGRILITDKRSETRAYISVEDAKAEGGYTPYEFEKLYRRMDYAWQKRYVYTFKFIPTEKGSR